MSGMRQKGGIGSRLGKAHRGGKAIGVWGMALGNKLVIGIGVSIVVVGIVLSVVGAGLRIYTETTELGWGFTTTEKPYYDIGVMLFNAGLVMFVLGCVLTAVGTIARSPTRKAVGFERPLDASDEMTTKFCRHCGEEIEADSTYCEYCGVQL